MKTNYWFKCKKCKLNRTIYRPDKEELKRAKREFEEEHKECKNGKV